MCELGNDSEPNSPCEKVVVAIPREPLDFIQRAINVGHPRSVAISLPSDLKEVMDWNRNASPYVIFKHRIEFVKHWTQRAQQLKEEDAKLLSKAPSHLQGLLKGKRLALWQELVDHFANVWSVTFCKAFQLQDGCLIRTSFQEMSDLPVWTLTLWGH